MAPLRTVADLLAEQSEETLRQMHESLKSELARLTVELQQVDEALAKKTRKARAASGGGRLSRDQVYEVMREATSPKTPADVQAQLLRLGYSVTPNAVRNHLRRLEGEGLLRRDGNEYSVQAIQFVPPPTVPVPQTEDEDIPF
jgi:DNA-binding transcriptional ArsR family regulator